MLTFPKIPTFAVTLAAAACVFSACSSSTASPPASTGDDGGSSGGSSSGSSSGGSCTGTGKVSTNVTFDSMGKPTCATGVGCDLSSNICCIGSAGGKCTAKATGCTANYGSFGCIDDSTCPSGQVCCFQADSNAMTLGSSCQEVSSTGGKCTPAVSDTAGSAQLCQTNSECKSGCCAWQDCTVTLSDAGVTKMLSLTMCGDPPTSSAFSCTKH